jgi:hypothetical protein
LLLISKKYGFGIRKKTIPDPGAKKAPGLGSRSTKLHWTGVLQEFANMANKFLTDHQIHMKGWMFDGFRGS